MAKFEVFVPQAGPGGHDVTLRVEADNWLAALHAGMKKLGQKDGPSSSNLLVDIQDDESIHVTDSKTKRVFMLRELEPEGMSEAPAEKVGVSSIPAAPSPFDPRPYQKTQLELPAARPPTGNAFAPVQPGSRPPTGSAFAPVQPGHRPADPPTQPGVPAVHHGGFPLPPAQVGSGTPTGQPGTGSARPPTGGLRPRTRPELRRPSAQAMKVVEVSDTEVPATKPRGRIGREIAPKPEQVKQVDDVLAELFELVQSLDEYPSPDEALEALLDLAMSKIDCESGSVFLADLSTNDLTLGAARGPKAKELLKMNPRVPMGVGIVGFSAMEGVTLAISEVQRDPRFYRAISDRLGYATKSILCSPMMLGGRSFGCLEVLNKRGSSRFDEGEVAILNYLAEQCAKYLDRA